VAKDNRETARKVDSADNAERRTPTGRTTPTGPRAAKPTTPTAPNAERGTPIVKTLPHDGDCGLWWWQTSSFAGGFAVKANLGK
jgi:hypothetical protein